MPSIFLIQQNLQGSPGVLLTPSLLLPPSWPAPDLCSSDACTIPVAIEAGIWAPVAITGGLLATRWNPSHACLQTLAAKSSFQNLQAAQCSSSVGFTFLGLFVPNRLQGTGAALFEEIPGPMGTCPRDNFAGSSKTWSFKTDWWIQWGRSNTNEFHGFWSILK